MTVISPSEMQELSGFLMQKTGIELDSSKTYLVENRLEGLLNELKLRSFGELLHRLRTDSGQQLTRTLIDLMTTQETSFFRDGAPFELLVQKVLPDLMDRKKRLKSGFSPMIRIWSAACSTGQEVYSLAMLLMDACQGTGALQVRILGTDISDHAIARASRGRYSRVEVDRGLSADQLRRFFIQEPNGSYRIKDEVRALVNFRQHNLMEDFTTLGRFDVILCRNVAIYFGEKDRIRLFNRLGYALEPEGVLLVGALETVSGLCPQFQSHRYLRSVYYQVGVNPQA